MEGHRSLLDDLEREYAARDNYNTVFRKAFGQCGLFDLVRAEANRIVGVRISDEIWESPVLYRRLRFVLDHPTSYKEWSAHLDVDKLPATPESRPSLRG